MVGVEAEGASVGLLSPEAEEAIDLGVAVGATDPFGRGSPVNWAASGASTRAVRASSNACTLTPLSTGVSVVVMSYLLMWMTDG
jgi:hypothetical protein